MVTIFCNRAAPHRLRAQGRVAFQSRSRFLRYCRMAERSRYRSRSRAGGGRRERPLSADYLRVTANDGEVGAQFLGRERAQHPQHRLHAAIKTLIHFKQLVGRGTRLFEGKSRFLRWERPPRLWRRASWPKPRSTAIQTTSFPWYTGWRIKKGVPTQIPLDGRSHHIRLPPPEVAYVFCGRSVASADRKTQSFRCL